MNEANEVIAVLPMIWKIALGICGMIVAIGGAAAIISKLFAPIRRLEARVDELEKTHARDQEDNIERLAQDHDDINKLNESTRHICECMLAIMDHEITGNSIERLKQSRNDMNSFLINR